MLPKTVFDKTEFVKSKINNFKQNMNETDANNKRTIGKSIPASEF
jgi:hypothetical protein